ncbi:RNA polymerase-associated protein RapA [anaerobic digester metagenome]
MKMLIGGGANRIFDVLRRSGDSWHSLDLIAQAFSLFAFGEIHEILAKAKPCRLIIPLLPLSALLGTSAERSYRNRLQTRWLAQECGSWLEKNAQIRCAESPPETQALLWRGKEGLGAVIGINAFTTAGLGLTPGSASALPQQAETAEECAALDAWFAGLWCNLSEHKAFWENVRQLGSYTELDKLYHAILYTIFKDSGEELDEERIIRSATGIKDTVVWQKLFRFQRDGVIGAIDKLEKYGGCIIADSVGLGKTFEALAVIKYYELRNDRVLVLCPKKLRDNWSIYCANDRRNILASDRFNYDVLNHTDLSRDRGTSGDIDLANINWGNYDLLVIDESHNFRNKPTHKKRDSRYDRLMERVIKSGVKTRVLMLSATPVNNRLTDLKNQITFGTEGNDAALAPQGISSIDKTIRQAQKSFNLWLGLPEAERTTSRLLDMLGFDYFKLLETVTIARSRKHIERYYGTAETGKFPERLKPINIKSDIDRSNVLASIATINKEIRRLTLAAYAPLSYVLPQYREEYEAKYGTELSDGKVIFKQLDRETSLIHLLRVNTLKRLESSVNSFAITVDRHLVDIESLLAKLTADLTDIEEPTIEDIDVDDPDFEPLLAGRKVKVHLAHVDRLRWQQDLEEDRDRLHTLVDAAKAVVPDRDAKLTKLKESITQKATTPFNAGNKKVIVFTAFADTARYLFDEIAPWALRELSLHTALVTGGTNGNKTTLPRLSKDLASVLTAFSPRSKERRAEFEAEGTLDILIATDCISEGQNLQDCDYLINYDIHWNPVRIIQRFGRIDRIGSANDSIQLVNFWPNMELDAYINLEQRVTGRMALLDASATGEENLLSEQPGTQMNDLEYRRKQLLKLQESVLDMEDLPDTVSITDLTLNDFRMDLSRYLKEHPGSLNDLPLGISAVVESVEGIAPGTIFCLRAEDNASRYALDQDYPLAPYYLVHIGEDGATSLPYNQARKVLDLLKKLCAKNSDNAEACAHFDQATRNGKNMEVIREQLAAAVRSITGKQEERAVQSLFSPGGTHALKGEFSGVNDFEVLAFLVILPGKDMA